MGSSSRMDIVASAILFGVILTTVGRVQANMNSTMYYNTNNYVTQNFVLALSKQIEFDFTKMGYGIDSAKIGLAERNAIRFSYRLRGEQTRRTIGYSVDVAKRASETINPRDLTMVRTENGSVVEQNIGITEFTLTYYNAAMEEISTPVNGARLDSIRAVRVSFRIESFEPIILPEGEQYVSMPWQKLLYPKNLVTFIKGCRHGS
ncbi:MAG: hypothetical protein MN733_33005 [Nitrososphaera sp.]|nr:hypothetical protein [Nitrososphaera sp.]MCI0707006.1 hypothetical protein [Ignavibacteriota bacterium]